MKFTALPLMGAYRIELEKHVDERGYFAETFSLKQFAEHQLVTNFIHMATAFNPKKGQIRGMHYQEDPYAQTKVVRCTRGQLYDVMIDLRKNSPTYNQWYKELLTEDAGNMLYIPKGFAHGYKTLESNTTIFYMMDELYVKESARELPYTQWDFFK
jgi:dTDP-4-dehydrorhamnose 3,5-epimerase